MVKHQLPKLRSGVRFPSPADRNAPYLHDFRADTVLVFSAVITPDTLRNPLCVRKTLPASDLKECKHQHTAESKSFTIRQIRFLKTVMPSHWFCLFLTISVYS